VENHGFDAIVIGGGISGLCAAYYLTCLDRRVALFEPGEIGGVIKTIHRDGFTLELGPNVLVYKSAMQELLMQLQLTDQVIYPAFESYKQMVWFKGRACNVPKSLLAFLFSDLLEFSDKIKVLGKIFQRNQFSKGLKDESVANFFSQALTERIVSRIIDPVLRGIYGGDISKLSARSVFPVLWNAKINGASWFDYLRSRSSGKPKVFVLQGGMRSLVSAMYSRIRDQIRHLPEKVRSITKTVMGYEVVGESGESVTASKVFIATSGAATASYLGTLIPDKQDQIKKIRYAPIIVVHVSISDQFQLPSKSFGVLFPSSRGQALLGIMFNSLLFPHVAPKGKQLLTLCFGGVGHENILEENDDVIFMNTKAQLGAVLGVKECEMLSIQRWPQAIPQYGEGHYALVRELEMISEKFPGIFFVGADRAGVGVPDRIQLVKDTLMSI
jgi:protoporphyrinogen/coproporphyrinogen III oxidase